MNTKIHIVAQSTIKMKLVDVKSSTYIDFGVEKNEKDSRFEVNYH